MSNGLPTNVLPFKLPLDRDGFKAALQKGQGRALMHIMRHGPTGFEQLILDACLCNQAYDPQCEGGRADWMIEIIDAAGIQEKLQPQLLNGLRVSGSDDYWNQAQLCRLAFIFARRGNNEFRRRLYAAFRKCERSSDLIAGEEIIELDGADGLLFVAERAGQWVADDPGIYVGDFLIGFYDEKHGAGAAERILRAAADHNALIATYLDHVDANEETGPDDSEFERGQGTVNPDMLERFGTRKKSRLDPALSRSVDDIIGEIEATDPSENRHRYLYRRWGRQASEQELRKVADAMFAERDEKRVFLYLHVFQARGLPEMDPRLRRLAESQDDGIRWIAYSVMANHEHPIVRSLAIDRISAGRITEGELRLLCRNYQRGDWSLIERAMRLPDEQHELHDIVSDLLDVFEANKVEESYSPLVFVYDHSPCAVCRHGAVKVLIELGQAPDWVLEECNLDVDEDTRSMVRIGQS